MIARKVTPVPLLTSRRQVSLRLVWAKYVLSFFILITTDRAVSQGDPVADPAAAPVATGEIAPEAEVATEIPLYKSRSERDNQLLAKAAVEEVRWLETPNGQILALYRPTETRDKKGVLILLHAAETPPGWPAALENVRRALPQQGWATFALALPPKSAPSLPDRDPPAPAAIEQTAEPEEPNSNPAEPAIAQSVEAEPPATERASTELPTNDTPDAAVEAPDEPQPVRAEIVAQRLAAALAWLAEEQHTPVFLLVDNSSVMETLAYLQAQPENPLAAIILVNLQAQEALKLSELEAIFTESSPPVLDVFFAPDQRQAPDIRRHRAVALRNDVQVYQQLLLQRQLPATLDDKKSFWAERLRGFMEQQTKAEKSR